MKPETCPPEGCIALKHVLDAVTDNKEVTKALLEGQHQLDKSITKLNENVIDIKSLGKRVGAVERNQWKILAFVSVFTPIITAGIIMYIKG